MAHVLLPCDLPNWAELQRQLSQVRLSQNVEQLTDHMLKIFDACSVNLDPEDSTVLGDKSRFKGFHSYVNETLLEAEKLHFFKAVLPSLVSNSQRLRIARPICPFQFSLQQEEKISHLERRFIASILANAIFSTFPRRTMKTHPTLQDFSFGDFFRYLIKSNQQEKLKYILKYYEKISVTDPKGTIRFCRKVLSESSIPSLPSWLCNIKPLCSLAARPYGNIEDSEPQMIKACFSSRRLGGKCLTDGDDQESLMFCRIPELLTALCFVESLEDNEAVLVQGLTVLSRLGDSPMSYLDGDALADVVLMDALDFSGDVYRQYEDKSLLRELTKLLVAFSQPNNMRRPSPIGESSGSSTCPDRESPATGTTGPSSSKSSRSSYQSGSGQDGLGKTDIFKTYSGPELSKPKPYNVFSHSSSGPRHSLPIIKRSLKSELQNISESSSKCSTERESIASAVLPATGQIPRSNSAPQANLLNNNTSVFQPQFSSWRPSSTKKAANAKSSEDSSKHCKNDASPKRSRKSPSKNRPSRSHTHEGTSDAQKGGVKTEKGTLDRVPSIPVSLSSFSSARRQSLPKIVPKRHVRNQTSGEEEYYTADESVDSGDEEVWFLPGLGLHSSKDNDSSSLIPTPTSVGTTSAQYRRLSSKSESSRSSSGETRKEKSGSGRSKRRSRSKSSSPVSSTPVARRPRRPSSSDGRSFSRSASNDSKGFALGDGSDDEDEDSLNFSEFERYEDFRKRFRRRSRGLSRRRSSRHSRTSSSGSSEMEDIEEDPELGLGMFGGSGPTLRSASSEPSLVTPNGNDSTTQLANLLAVPADTLIMAKRGRKLVMTTGDGQLKAYSYDGVHPNLPVPFKAKFRQRKSSDSCDAVCDLQTNGRHFYSSANAGFWKKVDEEAQIGVTSASSSQDDIGESDQSLDERSDGRPSFSSGSKRSASPRDDFNLLEEEEKYYSLLRPSEEGIKPVATGRWGCGRQRGDPQLKAVLQWLAASVAGLPCLIYYTKGDPYLEQLEQLSKVADIKSWTVGDVACETLRYCRNRISLHKNASAEQHQAPFLFTILIGDTLLMKQESLD